MVLNSKIHTGGNSLVVQCLGLGAFTVVAWVQSLVRELRSHKLCGQKTTNKQTNKYPLKTKTNKTLERFPPIPVP